MANGQWNWRRKDYPTLSNHLNSSGVSHRRHPLPHPTSQAMLVTQRLPSALSPILPGMCMHVGKCSLDDGALKSVLSTWRIDRTKALGSAPYAYKTTAVIREVSDFPAELPTLPFKTPGRVERGRHTQPTTPGPGQAARSALCAANHFLRPCH